MQGVLHWFYIVFRNKSTHHTILTAGIYFIDMFDPIFMYLGSK